MLTHQKLENPSRPWQGCTLPLKKNTSKQKSKVGRIHPLGIQSPPENGNGT